MKKGIFCSGILLMETLCYIVLFRFLSTHHEFQNLVVHARGASLEIFDSVSRFLRDGGLKQEAFVLFLLLLLCILSTVACVLRKVKAASFARVCVSSLFIKGLLCLFLFSAALFFILNDKMYCVETMLMTISVQLFAGLAFYWIASCACLVVSSCSRENKA